MQIHDLKIRVPAEIKTLLVDRASNNDRTINGEVLQILKAALCGAKAKAVKELT